MSTGRLEAFSDGVMAVAITLLALNIKVPSPEAGRLAHGLAHQWPAYVAYVISFLTIGIIWINHHAAIGRLRQADHMVLVFNLLLLMSICVLPFSTGLMASYLTHNGGERLAAAVYSGSLLTMAACFSLLMWYTLQVRSELLVESLTPEQRQALFVRGVSGSLPYALALALALVSPYATLLICGGVAVFYALPAANTLRE
jgi:uncharacterized membrane protein